MAAWVLRGAVRGNFQRAAVIVNVGLSPKSVVDIANSKQGPTGSALQLALAERIRGHGALVMASKAEAQALLHVVQHGAGLTESERYRWRELLSWLQAGERLKIAHPAFNALDDSRDLSDVPAEAHRPFVAVVSNETFGHLFPDNADGVTAHAGGLDIATSGAATLSSLFQHTEQTAAREVYVSGTSRDTVWSEILRPLATRSKRVTLFDRYVFSAMYRRDSEGDSTPEHLEWLLRRLNAEAPPGTMVKIFGSRKGAGADTPLQVAQLLRQRWAEAPNRVAGVELVTLPANHEFPHDRHITFGDTTGLELPSGLDRLALPSVGKPFSFGYKWKLRQLDALRHRVTTVLGMNPTVTPLIL